MLAPVTKKQYNRMMAEGLSDLNKSGIAELTFKTVTNMPVIELSALRRFGS